MVKEVIITKADNGYVLKADGRLMFAAGLNEVASRIIELFREREFAEVVSSFKEGSTDGMHPSKDSSKNTGGAG